MEWVNVGWKGCWDELKQGAQIIEMGQTRA
jgi:hypothetical protein